MGLLMLFGCSFSLAAGLTLVRRESIVESSSPAASAAAVNIITARTTSGLLKGIKQASIIKFLAVPYAEAPIGSLRFKRPEELKANNLERVTDATHFGKTCPQYRHLTQFISPLLNIDADHQTSEDCLQLNIFVPANIQNSVTTNNQQQHQQQHLEPNKQLPVIVWIPGEGFDFADARQFDGSHLALKTQSIVVTVQYRVGVLGFLHAPKLNITGNMGIYDQLMALRWVHKNIDTFGGDSERVTLMGRFSGSMSISTMITAPAHQDLLKLDGRLLFQRVALLSGIAVDQWIIDSSQHERVSGLEGAALARDYCNAEQINRGTCLSGLSVEQLMRIADYGWRLVKDNELIGDRSPIEAAKSAEQFPSELEGVLLGETGMEGTLCMYRHALDTSRAHNYAQLIDEDKLTSQDLYNVIRDDSQTYFRYNPNKTNPIELALSSLIDSTIEQQQQQNYNEAHELVAAASAPTARLREKYLNACSAYMVKSHAHRFKRNLMVRNQQLDNRMDSSKRPTEVYHYELRYKPSFSLAPEYIRVAAHGDDIPLIFGLIYNQPRNEMNEADLLMTRKMMSYIGNFVHGNQPLLTGGGNSNNNETFVVDSNNDDNISSADGPVSATLAINIRARSWANEGQLHHIELDEGDLQELNARRRQRQSSNGSGNNNGEEVDGGTSKSSVRADKSTAVNIRLFLVDNINQQQQPQPQQAQPVIPSQQTNMTLINESSFVTILLFGICLVMFALMSTCLGLCLVIFRGSMSVVAKSCQRDQQNIQQLHHQHNHSQHLQQHQHHHHVGNGSSTSSCNICEESQGGSIDAVLGGGAKTKDARAFSNVFAKLRNNQASQSHHHPQQQQQQQLAQQMTIDGQRS